MQHRTVADPLSGQRLPAGQHGAVGSPEQPAAVLFSVVGEPLTGVAQHLGQQLGEGHLLR